MTPRVWTRWPSHKVLRPYRFPCAFLGSRVRLAIQVHSLGRFSKRTTRRRLVSFLTGGSLLGHFKRRLVRPVARSPTDFRPYCTALLGVLFSVRSRYLFAIGLEECLAFPGDAWSVHRGYPTPATLDLTPSVLTHLTGLSPCFTLRSRRLQMSCRDLSVNPNTTLVRRPSVWAVSRLLAVTDDIAVAFSSSPY